MKILQAFFEGIMRIDKYLKVSRIIKRRTVANEACGSGRVSVNNKTAKPGTDVKSGDIISIRFGSHTGLYEILNTSETVRKDQASAMYRVIQEDEAAETERNAE